MNETDKMEAQLLYLILHDLLGNEDAISDISKPHTVYWARNQSENQGLHTYQHDYHHGKQMIPQKRTGPTGSLSG